MTDLFVCECCGCVDSIHATQQLTPGFKCSECATGSWHGQFPKEQYDPEEHLDVLNRTGHGTSFS